MICIYTHAPCHDGCSGADETCKQLARKELEQARDYFVKAGGYNIAKGRSKIPRWHPVAVPPGTLELLKQATRRFLGITGIPNALMPPPIKAANRCPGCKRPIADNLQYCGRPTCWRGVHGPMETGEAMQDAVDAMHRQRGCGPFSLGWKAGEPRS
jgi:hypothetical protein